MDTTSSGNSTSTGGDGTGGSTTTSSTGGSGGTGGIAGPACGNGKVEGTEECDDGNLTSDDGCNNDCSFTCIAGNPTRDHCDDGNACNGIETCGADHACAPGTALNQGDACDTDRICVGGNCVDGSCGDGITSGTEECDDGNAQSGDGCEAGCTFSCLSTDPKRNCASTDPCVNNGTCDDVTHTCTASAPLSNGASCGTGQICVNGGCVAQQCGDGIPSTGEACDFGTAGNLAGSGCEPTCAFSCTTAPNSCDDENPCNGAETCAQVMGPNSTAGQKCAAGTPLPDGTACGGGKVCKTGVCSTPGAVCGNGIKEAGEACDLGAMNGTQQGCSATCQLDCTTNANCSDNNVCNGVETCKTVTVNGQQVGKCQAGTNAAKCAACSGGLCNGNGQCVASTCGDGCVDATKGEACDPPNGSTCSATCTSATVCGNGVLEAGEQCDDGNKLNLDGCDSNCKYEVVARMTSVSIQGTAAPAFCTPTTNRLGTQSLTSTALGQINTPLQDGITDGTTNILVQALGLDDLTGVADPNGLTIGVLSGTLDPAKGTWPSNNPIDWWFRAEQTTVNNMGLPTGILTNGALAARNLTAGPSDINLTLLLAGSPALLRMRNSRVAATFNGTPAPNAPAPPPAQLAAGLTVFQTITASGANQGLCGNITVESLSQIPIPEVLTTGATACGACTGSKKYTYCGSGMPVGPNCNSLLDALVGGCKVVACLVTAINAQQPDVMGTDNDIDTLAVAGTLNKIPQASITGNDDAYSAYMKFDANRAHFTGTNCTATTDCQTGKTCVNNVCQ
ncbi:Multiple EGF-like-domain protein 3 precursor [Minicystis rosea]|nr:Multiple EGF-like-domain protein 3 precursor [Minicystis rosea]